MLITLFFKGLSLGSLNKSVHRLSVFTNLETLLILIFICGMSV
jgi:hypothetical protein